MTIRIDREGETVIVTIDRPAARNAVDTETATALFEAFVAFDRDETAKVAVLRGEGPAFCAGFDLKAASGDAIDEKWYAELHLDPSFDGHDDRPQKGPMGPTRLAMSKPVIAAIAGPAVAGGMELPCGVTCASWSARPTRACTAAAGASR